MSTLVSPLVTRVVGLRLALSQLEGTPPLSQLASTIGIRPPRTFTVNQFSFWEISIPNVANEAGWVLVSHTPCRVPSLFIDISTPPSSLKIKSLGVHSEWEARGKARVATARCGGESGMGRPFGVADLGEWRPLLVPPRGQVIYQHIIPRPPSDETLQLPALLDLHYCPVTIFVLAK